jgi:hypothetical protein
MYTTKMTVMQRTMCKVIGGVEEEGNGAQSAIHVKETQETV